VIGQPAEEQQGEQQATAYTPKIAVSVTAENPHSCCQTEYIGDGAAAATRNVPSSTPADQKATGPERRARCRARDGVGRVRATASRNSRRPRLIAECRRVLKIETDTLRR
jgi:hypothetical protein